MTGFWGLLLRADALYPSALALDGWPTLHAPFLGASLRGKRISADRLDTWSIRRTLLVQNAFKLRFCERRKLRLATRGGCRAMPVATDR